MAGAPGSTPCRQDMDTLLEARFFKALCDPNRIAILIELAECAAPRTVSQIADGNPADISVVSRHLAILRDVDILDASRRGREVYYSVRYATLATTLRAMAEAIDACCPADAVHAKESSHE